MIVPEDISWDGAKKNKWAAEYLATLDWEWVTNRKYKRFVCPKCAEDGARGRDIPLAPGCCSLGLILDAALSGSSRMLPSQAHPVHAADVTRS